MISVTFIANGEAVLLFGSKEKEASNQWFLSVFIHLTIPATSNTVIKPQAISAAVLATVPDIASTLYNSRIIERTVSMINNEDSILIREVIWLSTVRKKPGSNINVIIIKNRLENTPSPLLKGQIINKLAITFRDEQKINDHFFVIINTSNDWKYYNQIILI